MLVPVDRGGHEQLGLPLFTNTQLQQQEVNNS